MIKVGDIVILKNCIGFEGSIGKVVGIYTASNTNFPYQVDIFCKQTESYDKIVCAEYEIEVIYRDEENR